MSHFLFLWKPEQVVFDKQRLDETGKGFEHAWSGQFNRVSAGDHLWVISVYEGKLFLNGHLHVRKILSTSDAATYLQGTDFDPKDFQSVTKSDFHVVTRSDEAEPLEIIDIHKRASALRFNSSTGRDRLTIDDDGSLKPQQLQTMPELTPESAELLEDIWYEDAGEAEEDVSPEAAAQYADLEHRLEVEAASVRFSTEQLEGEGWKVKSKEAQKIGYDLHCTKDDRSLHVEVKGTSGEDQSFIITANELAQAKSDSDFILFRVTKALDINPILHRFLGHELITSFRFEPLQFRAVKKT